MAAPGPPELGRGVVVDGDGRSPGPWRGAPEVGVDEAALADPATTVARLHHAWATRQAVVVRLAVDAATFRQPVSFDQEPWRLDAGFEAWLDRLHFLVWANNYDARGGQAPLWWWARKAARLGARLTPDGPADVVLARGEPAWVDGGPRAPLALPMVHAETVDLGRLDLAPRPQSLGGPRPAHLAPDQRAAVEHRSGPARVIAPAGSGKTRVLTERLRHLLGDRGVERETVLAVAFNKKAQGELTFRCAAFAPRVATLNALGYEILARARGSRPPLLEERDVRQVLQGIVPRQPRRANVDPLGPYLEGLAAVRLGLRDPEAVEDERDDVPGLAAAFGAYRDALGRRGAVDFDEQVYGAIASLLADGELRRAEQARHRHLLVDELQDLAPAHVLLLRLLATPGLDLFGVGDDDQVIYGHAGADPRFLIDFEQLFPGAASYALEVNYRCPEAVVKGARSLLSYNRRRVAKEIRPGPGATTAADALSVRRLAFEEAAAAVGSLVGAWLEEGVAPAQVAVLCRVNSLLLVPHLVLTRAGVPVDSALNPAVLSRTGFGAALAYLRMATSPDAFARADLMAILRRPSRGLPQWVERWFRGRRVGVADIRQAAGRMDDAKVAGKLEALADDVAHIAEVAAGGTTRDVFRAVRERVGLGRAMDLLDSSATAGSPSHLDDLLALEQVAALHPDPAGFEPWLREQVRAVSERSGVTVSTVHRVKGREWDKVVVFGATSGVVPHRLAADVEEERRVLHVAITRGRRQVVVVADSERPSPFLDELAGVAPRPASTPPRRPMARPEPAPSSPRRARPTPALAPEAAGAAHALRQWRAERARQDRTPAFVVLHDRHLEAIAAGNPTSLEALARLPGIGPHKLEAYGEEILAALARAAST